MSWTAIIYAHIIFVLIWVLIIWYFLSDEKNRCCSCPCEIYWVVFAATITYIVFLLSSGIFLVSNYLAD